MCPEGCDVCELCLYYYTDCLYSPATKKKKKRITKKPKKTKAPKDYKKGKMKKSKSEKKGKKTKKPKKYKEPKKSKSEKKGKKSKSSKEQFFDSNAPSLSPPEEVDSITMFDLSVCGSYESRW